tara:strand:- start:4224 stop:5567 length:1344 start_codon:yes stop_codon:yes gene_type:complete
MNQSTIAAIASPPGMGAVSLIRISGSDAALVASRVFQGRPRKDWKPRYQHFGRIADSEGEKIDEVLLCYFPAPNSFTGEDVVELACHGGVVVTKQVLSAVLAAGAQPAEAGEFSQRAFFNGRIDLTQAEAIMDLISAQTELAAKAAQGQLEGKLGQEIQGIRAELIEVTAHVEAYIDFPEEDISPDSSQSILAKVDGILARIDGLLSTADQGRILREGLKTVICGAPNAGKSSLLNLLLGFDRAIVNDVAGTTRDTIEEVINLNGIPLRLIDTAGIRDGEGAVEKEGIKRSRDQMDTAELILLIIDASSDSAALDPIVIPESARVVRILNKSDLPQHSDWDEFDGFPISCHDSKSADLIRDYLYETLVKTGSVSTASQTAINTRHQHCLKQSRGSLERAKECLARGESPEFVSMDLRAALDSVGEVIGVTDVEEILGEIFSTFCIGK